MKENRDKNNTDKQIVLKERLENGFNLDLSNFSQHLDTDSAFFTYLQEKLSARIKFFIRTDLDKLVQALYRIDIDDRLSDQAFDLGEINKVSMKLAELIIMRQLQKLENSQDFYKNN